MRLARKGGARYRKLTARFPAARTRLRGHAWMDGVEMTAAMLVPMFALVLPVELGIAIPGLSAHMLMVISHVTKKNTANSPENDYAEWRSPWQQGQ